ncbi:MAG: hypothetical protein ACTHN5_00315 [Phycisphaerae bacterium]
MFGILAREAPVGVLLRRGPTRWCQAVLWRTDTDEVERGQWVHHRVYERRCDLSPDGKLLLYFAMNGAWESETKGAWTAISRPPYFTALALWPKGDCWDGGGLFDTNREVGIFGFGDHEKPLGRGKIPLRAGPHRLQRGRGECLGIYFPRMERDGWKYHKGKERENAQAYAWSRELPKEEAVLWKRSIGEVDHPVGKGVYYDEYWIKPWGKGEIDLTNVDWADVDQKGRLVFTRGGKLYAGRVREGEVESQELADFTGDRPVEISSPAWARRWP